MRTFHTPHEAAGWLAGQVRGQLRTDSRQVRAGDAFLAWPGARHDARQHVRAALAQGAAACLVESRGLQAFGLADAGPVAAYEGLKAAAGPIADVFLGEPTRMLQVLAVTGTNGKTSVAWWLSQALTRARPAGCAVIGTLGIGRPPQVQSTGLTTPDAVLMQSHFRRFADEGLSACAIEASSIGIVEGRLDGTRVRVAVFTNFTRDHLDYHGTMEAYWQAKERLFDWPGLQAAVVNLDDAQGHKLAARLAQGALDLWTFSCSPGPDGAAARLQALDISHHAGGLHFAVREGTQRIALHTQLVGQFNVSNLLGVIGALRAVGVPLAQAVEACSDLLPVPGRMERLGGPGEPLVAVDYAHTPDALAQALAALRPLARQRAGRLWCVFGCGGDRDASKRPLMAAAAQTGADRVVVTSDNPRSESAQAIIEQVMAGFTAQPGGASLAGGTTVIELEADRARAIAQAIARADADDVILLAGKGHETYQEIAGVRQPFDDREQARAALARRKTA